jgi:glycosyltransferase involved in cell wall biosynthesis
MGPWFEMTDILYDSRWIGKHGIGRFAGELQKLLTDLVPLRRRRPPWHPFDPILLSTILWRTKPRLFFSPGYNAPISSPCPFVFTLHDLNHLFVPENSSATKQAYYRYIVRPACQRAALILTVSEYSKVQITSWAQIENAKVINVSNGVGPPFAPSGNKYEPGYPYFLHVGNHKRHKNLPRLLQAFASSGVGSDVRLILTGPANSEICQQIAHLRLTRLVSFVEASQDERLAELYRGAVALLFPSLYEGFGLPALEALACGVPVLTSKVCSLPEVVGDAGVFVDPRDVDSIVNGIERLARESDLRDQLRLRGMSHAKKFSWAETAQRTWKTLESAAVTN